MSTNLAVGVVEAPVAPERKAKRPRWFWYAVIGGGLLVISTLRVITGANDIDSSGATAAMIGLTMPILLAGLGGLWSERAGVANIGLEGHDDPRHLGRRVLRLLLRSLGWTLWRHPARRRWWCSARSCDGDLRRRPHRVRCRGQPPRRWCRLLSRGPHVQEPPRWRRDTVTPAEDSFPALTIAPAADALGEMERSGTWLLADIAGILRALVNNLSVVTILTVLLVIGTWWVLWRTAFGLRLRSCGRGSSGGRDARRQRHQVQVHRRAHLRRIRRARRRLPRIGGLQPLPRRSNGVGAAISVSQR
jgi:hypothetical protein